MRVLVKLLIALLLAGVILFFAAEKIRAVGIHKGLAPLYVIPEDFERLNIEWWYNWSASCPTSPPGCVPMSWGGGDPNLSPDYDGYLLFLNEPDRPDQANKTPQEGVTLYKALKAKYPLAKFVVGNSFYPIWLVDFYNLCKVDNNCIVPDIWGVHMYNGNRDFLPRNFELYEQYLDQLPGIVWLTEFANVYGDVYADNMMLEWMKSYPKMRRKIQLQSLLYLKKICRIPPVLHHFPNLFLNLRVGS